MNILMPTQADIFKKRQRLVITLMFMAIIIIRRISNKKIPNVPIEEDALTRKLEREKLLHRLLHGGKCRELIRVSEQAFKKLCTILQHDGGLRPTQRMSVEEHVARFLHIVEKLNMNFTKDQLKNRMKSLKSNFSKWHDMFNGTALSGFSWNSETQLIEAEEEVWADLISAKPEAVILKTKKITNYEDLRILFSKQRASGEYAETAKEKHARLTKSAEIKIEKVSDVDDLLANDVVTLDNQEEDDDEDIQILRQTFVTPQQSSGAKKLTSRKRKVEVVDEPVPAPAPAPAPAPEPESFEKSIMNTFSDIANVMREGNKAFEKHDYTMEDIENKLEPMGLEPEEFAKACLYLSRNQSDAKILFSSSMKMRMVFLKMMLSGDK